MRPLNSLLFLMHPVPGGVMVSGRQAACMSWKAGSFQNLRAAGLWARKRGLGRSIGSYCIEALKKPPLGGFGMRMGGKASRALYQICHQGLLLVLTLPPG